MTQEEVLYAGQIFFKIWGIPFTGNRQSVGFILGRLVIGMIVALIFWRNTPTINLIFIGLGYGVLIILSLFLHILGHLVAGKFIGAPMDENFITPQLIETRYFQSSASVSKRIELIRTLAGVFTTLSLSLISSFIWRITGIHWWLLLTIFNLIIGIYVTLPMKGVDGEVIWRELS